MTKKRKKARRSKRKTGFIGRIPALLRITILVLFVAVCVAFTYRVTDSIETTTALEPRIELLSTEEPMRLLGSSSLGKATPAPSPAPQEESEESGNDEFDAAPLDMVFDATAVAEEQETMQTLPPITLTEADLTLPEDAQPLTLDFVKASAPVNAMLPVIKSVQTEKKQIAITIDDCYQMENMKTLIKAAAKVKGKLTFFPIGENIDRKGMSEILQDAVLKKGFEVENHTYHHVRVFRASEEEMCREIWDQHVALCKALGRNYEAHFFRFNGGDGEYCQRAHNYLDQLNYKAVASWSYSGSDAPLSAIKKRLQPGAIFLFHTTDRDTEILKEFIPYCVKQGYELVTLNELCGFSENKVSDLSTLQTEMPAARAFSWNYEDIKKENYSYRTMMIQEVLGREGFLSEKAKQDGAWTGYYGDKTVKAVKEYQEAHGLPVTGVADRETQLTMFPSEA